MNDGKTLAGKAFEKNAYNPHSGYDKISSMRDDEGLVAKFQSLSREMMKLGITSYQNMCTLARAEDLSRLWQKAGLPFRLRLIKWADMNQDGTLVIPGKDMKKHPEDMPLLTVSGTKWLIDGTPIEQGAFNYTPYPGRKDWYGRMNYSNDEIEKACREAIARKDQLMFHVSGEHSLGNLLDVMEKINVDWKALRPRVEHGDYMDYSAGFLERARNLGIIVVQNPTHFAPGDGLPVSSKTYGHAMKTLLQKGIPLAIGSDGPFNPFLNIMLAVTHPVRPSEALTVEEAVIAYTSTAAFAEFEEHNKGTLTKGKLADLTVLSQDIFKIPPPALMATHSVLTLVGGKVVYDGGVLK
jgi:predicted amidohydrolase YtcJ